MRASARRRSPAWNRWTVGADGCRTSRTLVDARLLRSGGTPYTAAFSKSRRSWAAPSRGRGGHSSRFPRRLLSWNPTYYYYQVFPRGASRDRNSGDLPLTKWARGVASPRSTMPRAVSAAITARGLAFCRAATTPARGDRGRSGSAAPPQTAAMSTRRRSPPTFRVAPNDAASATRPRSANMTKHPKSWGGRGNPRRWARSWGYLEYAVGRSRDRPGQRAKSRPSPSPRQRRRRRAADRGDRLRARPRGAGLGR